MPILRCKGPDCRNKLPPQHANSARTGVTAPAYCSQACRQKAYEERHGLRVVHKPRRCETCGTTFTPDRSTARYCSTECRLAGYGEVLKERRAASKRPARGTRRPAVRTARRPAVRAKGRTARRAR